MTVFGESQVKAQVTLIVPAADAPVAGPARGGEDRGDRY